MTRRLQELQLAVMLLTRLPAGRLADPAPGLAAGAWAFPLVGLLPGAVLWAVLAGALALGLAPMGAALLGLGAAALLTGGLHHDGLADCADGLGGGRDRAHALEIMRDSRIGTYGVLALVFAIGLGAAALAQIGAGLGLAQALLIGVASRMAMLGAMWALPPARDDGLGQQVRGVAPGALLPGALLLAGLALWTGAGSLWVLALMAASGALLARRAQRRLGGQTGDVLGAVQLASETAGWVALAALLALG
ncbi:adenosylcobinamide-GDP ribazoletransferase [Rhabdonatronobacter sediminivivens]